VIDAVFLDIDGVLTDGTVWVDAGGNETKRIAFDDIDAVFELKRAKIKVGFITGEDNKFCQYVRDRFCPDFFLSGCSDKLNAFKRLAQEAGLNTAKVCYVGDSKKDIELLKYVNYSCVPADVDQQIKEAAKVVLKASRGNGVIKEVAERVLLNNGGMASA
jgi:3-deoxy-D-manno-octulosonate 8-phosphate phosphatase (KDO 8-P phosphatase)